MRGKDDIGPCLANRCGHFGDRGRGKGGAAVISGLPGLENCRLGGKPPGVKNLAPAIRKPPIPHDQRMRVGPELPGDRLHRIGAATGNQSHMIGRVNCFQHRRNVAHNPLESLGHMVQRPVGEDHRKLIQSIRINRVKQCHLGPSVAK